MTTAPPVDHDALAEPATNVDLVADAIEEMRTDPDAADAAVERWKSGEDLVEREERLPTMDRWAQMEAMAQRLARSPLLPAHVRTGPDPEGNMMVILLVAHDLGLNATTALQKVNVIEGKPAMAAELMRMLVRRDGHQLWCDVEKDPAGEVLAVTWFGIRKDDPGREHAATFTIEEARAAGLANKAVWKAYREDMLSARATSRLCRRVFEDCLAGVSYTPEELGNIETAAPVPPDQPPAPEASEETKERLRQKIKDLTPDERDVVTRLWKERKLGALIPTRGIPPFRVNEQTAAEQVIADAKREAVADAEVVTSDPGQHDYEGPDGSDECATCGRPRADLIHPNPDAEAPFDISPGSAVLPATPPTGGEAPLPPCDADASETATEAPEAAESEEEPDPVAVIEADVAAMTVDQVYQALVDAGKSPNGPPKTIRRRLIAHRITLIGARGDF